MQLSKRQQETLDLLAQGKSNKQIAAALGIKQRTVEEHLKRVYAILQVHSAKEAIALLGKSTIGKKKRRAYARKQRKWKFEREARSPDDHTVGHTIARSNATRQEVHGLFGAVQKWPAQAGFVRYSHINIPTTRDLFLKLRYSKHSQELVPILVYLDEESEPRAKFMPENLGSWDRFKWSDEIAVGNVTAGIHAITFYTEGQEYGVADLDKFILFTEPPE